LAKSWLHLKKAENHRKIIAFDSFFIVTAFEVIILLISQVHSLKKQTYL